MRTHRSVLVDKAVVAHTEATAHAACTRRLTLMRFVWRDTTAGRLAQPPAALSQPTAAAASTRTTAYASAYIA